MSIRRRSRWASVAVAAVALTLPAPAARSEPGAPPAAPAASAAPFVLALDAGHGGSNLGAVGVGGTMEKRITLDLARRVRDRLHDTPGLEVVLCRDTDVLVPIRARARCAADAGAQLFVSLHANAAPPGVAPGSRRGFELYVLPPEDIEEDAVLAGLAAPSPAEGAWAGHRVRAAGMRAVQAASVIDAHLRRALGERLARGVRQGGAALDVLRGMSASAVLVEVGFLDHVEEGELLASPAGQERIAGAIADAVLAIRAAAPH
jgi:N-acetylmuramoyl-L-alanine amidase